MKRFAVSGIVAGVVILVLVVGYMSVMRSRADNLRAVAFEANSLVGKFIDKVGSVPEGKGKEAIQQSLTQVVKLVAEYNSELGGCLEKAKKVDVRGDEVVCKMIERSQTYILQCGNYAQKRDKSSLSQKAQTMIEGQKAADKILGTMDATDLGKTTDVTTKITGLLTALKKASVPPPPPTRIVYVRGDWSNPSYSDYQQEIANIVDEYNKGRKNLQLVFTHYKSGVYSPTDQRELNWAIDQRKQLLARLEVIKRDIPPGSIYDEHQSMLESMLSSAIVILTRFSNNPSGGNYQQVSAMSDSNTEAMNKRLKPFYGLR